MVTFNQNRIAGSRIMAGIAVLGLAAIASGCITQTKKLNVGAGGMSGRPVAILDNPAKPMRRGTNSLVAMGLANNLVDVALKASTGTYEKTAQIALPSLDPARIVEDKLLGLLATHYHASPSARLTLSGLPLKGGGSWPDKSRVGAVVAGARARGFDGVVLDIVPVTYDALTHGHGLTIGGARVVFAYWADVAIVDVASGKLLASGFCAHSGGANPRLKSVLAGEQSFVDERVRKIADKCAADMSKKILRKG